MENNSEKPKRGRPRNQLADKIQYLYPELNTRRALLNHVHSIDAHQVLQEIADPAMKVWYERDGHGKTVILSEIGRLGDPEMMRAALRRVYDKKLSTAQAVSLLRAVRKQRRGVASLVKDVHRAIDHYAFELTPAEVAEALESVAGDYRRLAAATVKQARE